jgi:hypothetical protein
MKARQAAAARYDQQNELCARIIAANLARYPPGSLPAVWARLVLGKAAPTIKGPLFSERLAA